MELLTIFLRTILVYFVVFLAMRLMGKREIGKLSVFDLVNSIMIAELAVLIVEDTRKKHAGRVRSHGYTSQRFKSSLRISP